MTEQIVPTAPDRAAIVIGDGTRAEITLPHTVGRYSRFPVALTREARDEDRRRRDVLRGATTAEVAAIAKVFDPVQVVIGQKLLRTAPVARFRRNPGQGAYLGYHCAVDATFHESHAGILYKSTRARFRSRSAPSQAKRRKIARGH